MKNLTKTKWFIFGTYILLVLAVLLICFVCATVLSKKNISGNVSFFETAENRTFDYRQAIQTLYKNNRMPNPDIVVLEIDDATVESLWDKYGDWPAPRGIYADVLNYIEKDKPQAVIFDLMFLKSLKNSENDDKYFTDTIKNITMYIQV